MSELPTDYASLLALSHTNADAFTAITALMVVTSYTSDPDNQYVQLTDDSYLPPIMSGKYVSQDDYNTGCFYCTVCTNVIWQQYRNQMELAMCYYCSPPVDAIKLMSMKSIVTGLNELTTGLTALQTQVNALAAQIPQ